MALVRAAEDEQDAAIFVMAAFTGLRQGELVALRWRDVDFAGSLIRVSGSYTNGQLTTPKSGRVRAVPLAPQVAEALARLGQRGAYTGGEDRVFVGLLGGYVDASALRRRYKTALRCAGLRPLRFHDLRHTFGTTMIARADILRVKWMGHADVDMRLGWGTLGCTRLRQRVFLIQAGGRAPESCGSRCHTRLPSLPTLEDRWPPSCSCASSPNSTWTSLTVAYWNAGLDSARCTA